jgi:hypothetical protein
MRLRRGRLHVLAQVVGLRHATESFFGLPLGRAALRAEPRMAGACVPGAAVKKMKTGQESQQDIA